MWLDHVMEKTFANQTQTSRFQRQSTVKYSSVCWWIDGISGFLKTGIYNQSHTGVKREVAVNATIQMITSLAKCDRVNQVCGSGNWS